VIRVASQPEPKTFEANVRTPGRRAIAEMTGQTADRPKGQPHNKLAERPEDIPADKFPAYWQEALNDLMTAYSRICAYSCFRIHPVTGAQSVDHMAPKSRAWDRVYEWSNYRLACLRLNARKNNFSDILDPFEIEDGWFQLELVGFQVIPNFELDPALQASVQTTIERLKLNDFCGDRAHDAEYYWNGEVSLKFLTQESPFVAAELRRQGQLLKGDT
jgi:hypothetical protein